MEGSVICPSCEKKCLSFVNFELKMDGKLDFQMELFDSNDEESALVRFTCKQQDVVKQSCTVTFPCCEKMVELHIHLTKTIKDSQLKMKLSITTCAVKIKEMKKPPTGISIPALRKVKVFYQCSGETFHGDDQIKEQLMMDRWWTPHVQETDLKDCDIVIFFCPITSRVGSDVESSMRDETVSSLKKPIILVLMHHTRDPDYSTAGTIWSEVYPNVVLDVHVLFHESTPGLLKCRQNDEAFELIKKELNKHSKPSTRMLTFYP